MKVTILVMIPFSALVFWYYLEEDELGILKYLIVAAIFGLWGLAYLFEMFANKKLASAIWKLEKEERDQLLAELDPKQRKKVERIIEKTIQNKSVVTTPEALPPTS